MNGKASEIYSWGLPKLKNELRLLQKNPKKQTYNIRLRVFASTLKLEDNNKTDVEAAPRAVQPKK